MSISSLMYPNLMAKLQGMYAKKIKKAALEELMKQNSIKQVVALLKSMNEEFKGLEDNPKRIKIKIFLDHIFLMDVQKISRLLNKNDKKILHEFLSVYEIKCIKSVFRRVLSGNVNEQTNDITNWIDAIFKNLRGLETVKNKKDLIGFSKRTKYRAFFEKAFEQDEVSNVFEIENELDKFYFEHMMKVAQNYNASLEDMIGKKIDLNNMIWIYREKKNYHIEEAQVRKTLIPICYQLKKQELENLVKTNNENEMVEILKKTYYAKQIDFSELENLEAKADQFLYKLYQKYFRASMFDIGAVYAYLNMIDLENNDIMNVVEGIRYHLGKEEIRQKLV